VGIIGWPVEHSLSPAIHNAAFRALGLEWVYLPLPVEPGRLPGSLNDLREQRFAGANITMPHKEEGARLCSTLSGDAELCGAVNTVVVWPDGLAGHNTDVPGFLRFLTDDAGFDPAGRTALVFGAGGAARACALALARAGARSISLVARDPIRASAVGEVVKPFGTRFDPHEWGARPADPPDLVVNATPVGSGEEELPLPSLGAGQLVVDLLYRPPLTKLVATAREAGASAFGGLGLLLHQAALSFELWTGQLPPLEVMSAAGLAELEAEYR